MRRPAVRPAILTVLAGVALAGCSATTATGPSAPRLVESETVASVGGEISKDIDAMLQSGGPALPATAKPKTTAAPAKAAAPSRPKRATPKPRKPKVASPVRDASAPKTVPASGGGDVVELAARIAAAAGRDPVPVAPAAYTATPPTAGRPYGMVAGTRAVTPPLPAPPTGNYAGAGAVTTPAATAPVTAGSPSVPVGAAPNTVPGGQLLPQLQRSRVTMLPPAMPTGRVVQLTGPGYPAPGTAPTPADTTASDSAAKKRKVKRF